jgi:hypothetical protein
MMAILAHEYVPWRPLRVSVYAVFATLAWLVFSVVLVITVVPKLVLRPCFIFKRCPACGSRSMQVSDRYGLQLLSETFRDAWHVLKQEPSVVFFKKQICPLCKKRIWPGDKVLGIRPMAHYLGMECHLACWNRWPSRRRFIADYNTLDPGYVLCLDGSLDTLDEDGTVRFHDWHVFVAPVWAERRDGQE